MQYNYNTRQLQYNNTIQLQYNTLTLQYNYNTIELQYNFEQDYSTFCNRCGNGLIHPQGEPYFRPTLQHLLESMCKRPNTSASRILFSSNTTALFFVDVQTAWVSEGQHAFWYVKHNDSRERRWIWARPGWRLEVGSDRNYPCDREIAVKNTVPRGPGPSSAIGVTNFVPRAALLKTLWLALPEAEG